MACETPGTPDRMYKIRLQDSSTGLCRLKWSLTWCVKPIDGIAICYNEETWVIEFLLLLLLSDLKLIYINSSLNVASRFCDFKGNNVY